MSSKFLKKCALGTVAEQHVIKILSEFDIPSSKNPEKSNKKVMIEWDILSKIDGIEFKIECKFDKMASKTGNIAIEYYNVKQGKPSGIMATKSDLWIVVLGDDLSECWVCKTSELKKFFNETKPFKDITCGGDDNSAMMIYKKEDILPKIFYRFDNLKKDDLIELLTRLLGQ